MPLAGERARHHHVSARHLGGDPTRTPTPGRAPSIVPALGRYRWRLDKEPVGCRLSQANMIASLCGLRMCMDGVVGETDLHLSYVPLAHVFERSMQLLCLISGAAIGFYHGVQNALLEDLRELKPTLLVGCVRTLASSRDEHMGRSNACTPPPRCTALSCGLGPARVASPQVEGLTPPPHPGRLQAAGRFPPAPPQVHGHSPTVVEALPHALPVGVAAQAASQP